MSADDIAFEAKPVTRHEIIAAERAIAEARQGHLRAPHSAEVISEVGETLDQIRLLLKRLEVFTP
jgi:hypothetical protein